MITFRTNFYQFLAYEATRDFLLVMFRYSPFIRHQTFVSSLKTGNFISKIIFQRENEEIIIFNFDKFFNKCLIKVSNLNERLFCFIHKKKMKNDLKIKMEIYRDSPLSAFF